MTSKATNKGAKFNLKSTSSTALVITHNDVEVMDIQIKNKGKEADFSLEGKLISRIHFVGEQIQFQLGQKTKVHSEIKKKEKKKGDGKSEKKTSQETVELQTLGIVKVESEGKLIYEPVEPSTFNQVLMVEFSPDGAEFSVIRDKESIIQFASVDCPVGKSGGTARIVSGEKKSFCLSFLAMVYLSQLPLPKKDVFFQYKDTGQKPVLRTDSVNASPDEKEKKHKNESKKHKNESKKTSPTKAKVVVEKTKVEKPTLTSSSDSVEQDTPEDSTNSSEKSQNIKTREESRHTEASEDVIKSIRTIDEQQAEEISVNSLNECWSQLESIAIKNYD